MWIGNVVWGALDAQLKAVTLQLSQEGAKRNYAEGIVARLVAENERLRADLDWFKHRLNQVERERGQLIQSAIGVKIAVPEFVPAYDPEAALNGLPNLSTVGGDAVESSPSSLDEVDYSQMPGYRKNE